MPKKNSRKVGATKAATAASNVMLSEGNALGAALTTPFTEAAQFNGRVHYAGVAAFLIAPGLARLFIMFKPSGNYTPADLGTTASHLFVGSRQAGRRTDRRRGASLGMPSATSADGSPNEILSLVGHIGVEETTAAALMNIEKPLPKADGPASINWKQRRR
jgi:hypothetical protein